MFGGDEGIEDEFDVDNVVEEDMLKIFDFDLLFV